MYWTDGKATTLDNSEFASTAYGITMAGDSLLVVGVKNDAEGNINAYLWTPKTTVCLGNDAIASTVKHYGNNIYIGSNTEINMNCTFLDDNKIIIGKDGLIAPNVQIYTAFHPTNALERFGLKNRDGSFDFCKTQTKPVIIGDNVWIGGGVIILPGVTIGNNVVIGAGSVVTKDIPDNKIAYGNPCKVVRDNE